MEVNMPASGQDEALMDSQEAAKFIGLSVWRLLKARNNGSGPKYVKI
jgi:hypothetical protein